MTKRTFCEFVAAVLPPIIVKNFESPRRRQTEILKDLERIVGARKVRPWRVRQTWISIELIGPPYLTIHGRIRDHIVLPKIFSNKC